MRIIAGEFKGRRLKAVPGMQTRPTTDKVKESVFNMIGPYFNGGNCLDLFAGSGALGIEAVSRGADRAVLVDKQFKAVKTIEENIQTTKAADRFRVEKKSASQAVKQLAQEGSGFDLVFLDPPYADQQIEKDIRLLEEHGLLNELALVVCETDAKTVLSERVGELVKWKENTYGTIRITVYEKVEEEEQA